MAMPLSMGLALSFLLGLFVLAGCDFFSTREVLQKPLEIRSFAGLFTKGDSLRFSVTESLLKHGTDSVKEVLSKRRLVFKYLDDSAVDGKNLKVLSLNIFEDPSGILVESTERLMQFSGEGLLLSSASIGGGVRFYPLKRAASADTTTYTALPNVFSQGWKADQNIGVLTSLRSLSADQDTLLLAGHGEVTWKLLEKISDRGIELSSGQFWYGESGLLKVEETWPNYEWRDANALTPGSVDLHRHLERI